MDKVQNWWSVWFTCAEGSSPCLQTAEINQEVNLNHIHILWPQSWKFISSFWDMSWHTLRILSWKRWQCCWSEGAALYNLFLVWLCITCSHLWHPYLLLTNLDQLLCDSRGQMGNHTAMEDESNTSSSILCSQTKVQSQGGKNIWAQSLYDSHLLLWGIWHFPTFEKLQCLEANEWSGAGWSCLSKLSINSFCNKGKHMPYPFRHTSSVYFTPFCPLIRERFI